MRQDTVKFLTTTPLRDTPYPRGMIVKVKGWRHDLLGRVVLMRRGFDTVTADRNVGIRHEGAHFTRDPYGVYMLECRTEHGAESYIFAHESEMEVV